MRRARWPPNSARAPLSVPLDVTDPASIPAAFDAAEAALGGPCDILVNNAGIAVTKPLLQQGIEDWDGVMDVNLRGCFLVGQEAAKRLAAAKQPGSIINIASVLGERIIPGVAGYTAAKAGLLHLTRQMAVELARFGIRVNAIAPGYVATDINRDYFASRTRPGDDQAHSAAAAGVARRPDRAAAAARLRRRRAHDGRDGHGGWRPFGQRLVGTPRHGLRAAA